MKTKSKFEEALEQLTQLRIELLKVGNEKIEEKVSEIEMTICEGIDLLNNVDLANIRQRLCTNCHYCIPNKRSRYHYDRYFCTLDKNKVTISSPENYNCYGHKFNDA